MRIAITGEQGFIGTQLNHYFRNILKYEVVELGRNYLDQLSKVKDLDWLVHGAFFHRHENADTLIALNRELTKDTIACLLENNIQCNVVFLSSFHEELDTPYGQSKREAKEMLSKHCTAIDTQFISYKLPNVFGKYAVPNKTSFVATFCYNLHNELPVNYNKNLVKLASIDDVLPIITSFKENEIPYLEISVEEVYTLLTYFHETNTNHKFPELKSKFELDLYQTYCSYSNYKL